MKRLLLIKQGISFRLVLQENLHAMASSESFCLSNYIDTQERRKKQK